MDVSRDTEMKISICAVISVIVAEFLGYWLHRLLHSDTLRVLSRSHMKHHLVLYGPRQSQRPSSHYVDATTDQIALGNIGLEWLMPSGILLGGSIAFFCLLNSPLVSVRLRGGRAGLEFFVLQLLA